MGKDIPGWGKVNKRTHESKTGKSTKEHIAENTPTIPYNCVQGTVGPPFAWRERVDRKGGRS